MYKNNSGLVAKTKVRKFKEGLCLIRKVSVFKHPQRIHTQDRCTQALKSQPHSQAHFILLVPHKIKRACLSPTLD